MHTLTSSSRTIGAALIAVVIAAAAVAAQGPRGIGAQAGAPVVGTLKVDTVNETPTFVFAVDFSVSNATTTSSGGGGGAGKATFSEFKVARQPDGFSPALFKAAATGVHIPKVQIDVFRPGTTTIESSFILGDAVVSSFSTDASFERVAFSYGRIEIISGGTRACFDRVANESC